MLPQNQIRWDYDKKFDILHVAFADAVNSYGDDSEPGLIYLRDIDTDEFTGVTIMGFMKKFVADMLPKLKVDLPYTYADLAKCIVQ